MRSFTRGDLPQELHLRRLSPSPAQDTHISNVTASSTGVLIIRMQQTPVRHHMREGELITFLYFYCTPRAPLPTSSTKSWSADPLPVVCLLFTLLSVSVSNGSSLCKAIVWSCLLTHQDRTCLVSSLVIFLSVPFQTAPWIPDCQLAVPSDAMYVRRAPHTRRTAKEARPVLTNDQ